MKKLLPALLALLLLPLQASAQVADSLEVEIVAFPVAITLEGPARVSTSSTVTYRITTDPPDAAAHIVWSLTDAVTGAPADSAVAYFLEWSDSTATVLIGDAPGLFEVKAEAVPLDSIVIGRLDGGQVDFTQPIELREGEAAQLCAYGFSGDRALWVHPGPTCHSAPWPAAGTGLHQRVAVLRADVPLPPAEPEPTPVERALRRAFG